MGRIEKYQQGALFAKANLPCCPNNVLALEGIGMMGIQVCLDQTFAGETGGSDS